MEGAKLIIADDKEPIKISEEQLKAVMKLLKKTGYERVKKGNRFHFSIYGQALNIKPEAQNDVDDRLYETANYYSDRTVAENNMRADKLLRQLRRFAVEHRENELDWNSFLIGKYFIAYDYDYDDCENGLYVDSRCSSRDFGQIYFDEQETAQLAIETFKDELTWYFTEYKDSL